MEQNRKIRIAFFDAKPYDRRFFDAANRRYGFEIHYFEPRLTAETVMLAASFGAVCVFVNDDLGEATLKTLRHYKVPLIALRCAGYNNVDLTAAGGDFTIVRVPEYSPCAVAEYTAGLLLCLVRNYHRAFNRVRENNFAINGLLGFDLRGKTVGIVGTGRIGRAFAKVLQGFGMRLLASDPFPNHEAASALGLKYVALPELLRHSDVISLHCPLTCDNRHLINRDTLAHMKEGVILLNTSRGKLIDSQALIEALKSGRVGAAGLDVYEEEADYFYEDRSDRAIRDDLLARLMTFPNVIVTSHQAFFTREALANIAETTLANVKDFFGERKLANAVREKCAAK